MHIQQFSSEGQSMAPLMSQTNPQEFSVDETGMRNRSRFPLQTKHFFYWAWLYRKSSIHQARKGVWLG
jgi:hypothetical protein